MAECCQKDHPKVGDPVSVVRTDHGWFDGRLNATVRSVVHTATGGISYTVEDEEGLTHFCRRRGDVRLRRW